MVKKVFAVITADVIGSKESTGENTKSVLDKKVYEINKKIQELNISTLTPFHTSRGDEVQAVCHELKNVPKILRYLRFYCLPLKLRIGIGIGSIDYFFSNILKNVSYNELVTDIDFDERVYLYDYYKAKPLLDKYYNELNSWDMNGPAFYNARKALDALKFDGNSSQTRVLIEDANWCTAIQTIIDLMDINISKWTESKWRSIQMYDECGTYKKASSILDMTKQAVQGNCERANWSAIREAEINLSKVLEFLEKNNTVRF